VSHHHHPNRQQITAPLLRRDSIGDAYHVLTFDLPEGPEIHPGQFVMVRGTEWGQAPLLPRPMSYLSGGPRPSLLVKVVGEGTVRMGRAEPGELFTLLGPSGTPWRAPDPSKRQVFVAGGVGVAPLLFLARTYASPERRPLFIYGGRTAKDLPLHEDVASLCDLQITTEDGSLGTQGRVTALLPDLLKDGVEVFTCGPERMMAAVAGLAAQAGVPCEASLEAPMACGFGVCLGCPVPTVEGGYLYTCTEGPCVNAARIDWERAAHRPGAPSANGRSK